MGTYNTYNAVLVSKCGHVQPIQCSTGVILNYGHTQPPFSAVLLVSDGLARKRSSGVRFTGTHNH